MGKADQISVDLGLKTIQVPLWRQKLKNSPFNVLITAGMDGDELASIDAAYRLIDEFSVLPPKVNITIIPVINLPGFESRVSLNPLDGKFPKFVFPGKKNGSPTERLMRWLSEFVFLSDIWIDLHGGSMDEFLKPFIYLSFPKDKNHKSKTDKIAGSLNNCTVIYDSKHSWDYSDMSRFGIRVIIEAGYSGLRRKSMVKYHIDNVKNIIGLFLASPQKTKPNIKSVSLFSGVFEIKSAVHGLWYPEKFNYGNVKKNQILGHQKLITGQLIRSVKSDTDGTFLWAKNGIYCEKGDTLVGLAVS